ncbi:sulfatase-like hydrolase/transferase [Pirellulales bacterium]|nr:sulfatase-like hydrolase/transferase [Pirellulales bacterium]
MAARNIRRLRACRCWTHSLFCFAFAVFAVDARAQDLPNILWITTEDNAAHWIGCYGNAEARTPRIDALAAEGFLFSYAYSNAPVCAVARSTILNGAYAVTQGTQHMRSRYRTSAELKPYVSYLRERGYYCTNRSKTDYNQQGADKQIWDECSNRAHYKNRPEGAPFFAIFNLTDCHESSLFPEKVAQNRQRDFIPPQTRLDPSKLSLPPYLPDLAEIRSDFAIYYDTLQSTDGRVGKLLDELAEQNLADNTIVFYYSDHGGPTPRGKRYLKDTGVHVPMIVRIPPRLRDWAPWEPGEQVDELVAFVDLAPTALSLAGVAKPKQMQGRAFLGPDREAPPAKQTVFLYGDRFDELIGMRRGITDGRLKYIRRFLPHVPAAPYSLYQFSMPGWIAWRDAWQSGQLEGRHKSIWKSSQPVEELFDTESDPWEIRNLAGDPEYAERLSQMRSALRKTMSETRDSGVIPEALFAEVAGDASIYDYTSEHPGEMRNALDLAFVASDGDPGRLDELVAALESKDPVLRYWAATGCAVLGNAASSTAAKLKHRLDDPASAVRTAAAWALYAVGDIGAGRAALIAELNRELRDEEVILLLNAISHAGATDDVPQAWIDRITGNPKANEYLRRFAERIASQQ